MAAGKAGARVQHKSPAEFFAENQNIAGFDNPGKSLYTTVRELVENSLDAAEALGVLPDVELTITELAPESFARLRGVAGQRADQELYADRGAKRKAARTATPAAAGAKRKKAAAKQEEAPAADDAQVADADARAESGEANAQAGHDEDDDGEDAGDRRGAVGGEQFFQLTCKDNGCGMLHDQVPSMFGRVLAGSKYGVKQARGKFGLGAKMALIWSKKSTGLPIEVLTAHTMDTARPATSITYCKLDIDIHKNEPKVYKHEKRSNTECWPGNDPWHGSEVKLVISGNWTTYRSRVINYLQLLAVITPYARFRLNFVSEAAPKRSFSVEYARRSENMCQPAKEVKFHPKSVDNLIVNQLLHGLQRPAQTTMEKFLTSQFSCIKPALAKRLCEELSKLTKAEIDGKSKCNNVSERHVHQLTQLLRETTLFPNPNPDCLSPAGEYNLRLGIMKEFNPEIVATASSRAGVYAGHPFLVESALALGAPEGKVGITVHRFANRIPLLFEQGSDVVSVVANKKIKWSAYMVNPAKDKISVFVSIVSTKVPFKGTGKEYIGADITPIRDAVQEAMQLCARQLRAKVSQRRQADERASRLKSLVRYIPDVSQALFNIIKQAREHEATKQKQQGHDGGEQPDTSVPATPAAGQVGLLAKVAQLEQSELAGEALSPEVLAARLEKAVRQADENEAQELVRKRGRGEANCATFFLVSKRPPALDMGRPILSHPMLALRLFAKAESDAPPAPLATSQP